MTNRQQVNVQAKAEVIDILELHQLVMTGIVGLFSVILYLL